MSSYRKRAAFAGLGSIAHNFRPYAVYFMPKRSRMMGESIS
jgi:hypothetical protein